MMRNQKQREIKFWFDHPKQLQAVIYALCIAYREGEITEDRLIECCFLCHQFVTQSKEHIYETPKELVKK